MVADTFRRRSLDAKPWHLDALCWDGAVSGGGCGQVFAWGWKVTLYVAKKIFRKLLIFLALKDAVDRFSTAFHTGYLVEMAFDRQVIDRAALTGGERLIDVREAILETCRTVDSRPFNQLVRRILRSSKRVLLATSRLFAKTLRQNQEGEAASPNDETAVGGLIDRLTAAIRSEVDYQDLLERTFESALNRPRTATTGTDSSPRGGTESPPP